MPYGLGRGIGFGRGCGFGFRGAAPPYPFVGMGRGGLPRCWYFPGWTGAAPWAYPSAYRPFRAGATPWAYPSAYQPYYAPQPFSSYAPFTPPMSKEEELSYLKGQAEAIKDELERIEARVRELESQS